MSQGARFWLFLKIREWREECCRRKNVQPFCNLKQCISSTIAKTLRDLYSHCCRSHLTELKQMCGKIMSQTSRENSWHSEQCWFVQCFLQSWCNHTGAAPAMVLLPSQWYVLQDVSFLCKNRTRSSQANQLQRWSKSKVVQNAHKQTVLWEWMWPILPHLEQYPILKTSNPVEVKWKRSNSSCFLQLQSRLFVKPELGLLCSCNVNCVLSRNRNDDCLQS